MEIIKNVIIGIWMLGLLIGVIEMIRDSVGQKLIGSKEEAAVLAYLAAFFLAIVVIANV